jgi:hypothetical protein
MYCNITYIREKFLIDSRQINTEKNNNEALEFVKSEIVKYIELHGYYNARIKIMYNVKKPQYKKFIVSGCHKTKLNKIILCNINVGNTYDLKNITREINYQFQDVNLDQSTIDNITVKINEKLHENVLIVKDLKIVLTQEDNKTNITYYVHLDEASTNYKLTINNDIDIFKHKLDKDINNIYKYFILEEDRSYSNLHDKLSKYMIQHSFLKKIQIYVSENDNKQILDIRCNLSILAHFMLKNSHFFFFDEVDNKFTNVPIITADFNFINKLYLRIWYSYGNKIQGINARLKADLGYRKILYFGLNFYPSLFLNSSEVNIVLKTTHLINKMNFIARLNLRYFMFIKKIHISSILGCNINNFKLIAQIYEIRQPNLYALGIEAAYRKFFNIQSMVLFIGLHNIIRVTQLQKFQSFYYPVIQLDISTKKIKYILNIMIDNNEPNTGLIQNVFMGFSALYKINSYIKFGIKLLYSQKDKKMKYMPLLQIIYN